jgi:hypothetical protein
MRHAVVTTADTLGSMWKRIRPLVLLVALAAGCGDDGHQPIDAGIDAPPDSSIDGGVDPRPVVAEIPATPNRDLDLLFVIDDSPSMLDKQANLVANFPAFINVLASLPGGLPNLHLGVVSTDLGTKGSEAPPLTTSVGQVGQGGCSMSGKAGNLLTSGAAVTGTFISDIKQGDGSRLRNYTGSLDAVFGQMARLGAGGCGFEQPLSAMKAALDNNPANAGFLRPSALLGVVFLTDEDDCSIRTPTMFAPESPSLGPLQSFRCTRFGVTCSVGGTTPDQMNQVGAKSGCTGSVGNQFMTDVAPFRTFLTSLKGDTRLIVTASIMGPTTPFATELRTPPGGGSPMSAISHSCTYNGAQGLEVADPPVRIQQFLDLFPNASASETICQQSLSGSLGVIGQLVSRGIGAPCIVVPLADVDPSTPGAQHDCVVEETSGSTVTPIAACGSPPCWRFETDPTTCTLGAHLKLVVDRTSAPDPASVTRMRCRVP